jgi:hypothetical protein
LGGLKDPRMVSSVQLPPKIQDEINSLRLRMRHYPW